MVFCKKFSIDTIIHQNSLIRKKTEEFFSPSTVQDGVVPFYKKEEASRKNAIKIGVGKAIRQFYFHLALEWARLNPDFRFADCFIVAALRHRKYQTDLEIDENAPTELEMEVDGKPVTVPFATKFIKLLYEFSMAMDYLGCEALAEEAQKTLVYFSNENFKPVSNQVTTMLSPDDRGDILLNSDMIDSPEFYLVAKSNSRETKERVPVIFEHDYIDFIQKYYGTDVESSCKYTDGVSATIRSEGVVVWKIRVPRYLAYFSIDEPTLSPFFEEDQEAVIAEMNKLTFTCKNFWSQIKEKLNTPVLNIVAIENMMTKFKIGSDNVVGVLSVLRDNWRFDSNTVYTKSSTGTVDVLIVEEILMKNMNDQDVLEALATALHMDLLGVFGLYNFKGRINVLWMLVHAMEYMITRDYAVTFHRKGTTDSPVYLFLRNKIAAMNQYSRNPVCARFRMDVDDIYADGFVKIADSSTSCRLGITIPRHESLGTGIANIFPECWMPEWRKIKSLIEKKRILKQQLDALVQDIRDHYSGTVRSIVF